MEIPDEVLGVIGSKNVEEVCLKVVYKNWRGEIGERKIIPLGVKFSKNKFHKEEQWFLRVWDLDREEYRDYSIKDILSFEK